jgi:pimeloyl-ACP methyl ester carboxylesterase
MITEQDYALLSYATYSADVKNRLDPKDYGWKFITDYVSAAFYGAVYERNGEYVVSFRGTDGWLGPDFVTGNIPGGTGRYTPQIAMALQLVAKLQANGNPNLDNVTFTGHSLGGGLASVMAVFFDRKAVTFAEAPFENSVRDSLLGLTVLGFPEESVDDYYMEYVQRLLSAGIQSSYIDSRFSAYRAAWESSQAAGEAEFAAREQRVTDSYVSLLDPVHFLETPVMPIRKKLPGSVKSWALRPCSGAPNSFRAE